MADGVAQLRPYPRCPQICRFIPFEEVMNSFQGWSGRWFPKFSWCVSAFTRLGVCLNCILVPFDFFPLSHTHKWFPFLPRSANRLVSWGPSSCLPLFGILDRAQALNEFGHFWLVTSSPSLCTLHLFWRRTKCSSKLGWHSRDKLLFGDKNTVTFIWGFFVWVCFGLVFFGFLFVFVFYLFWVFLYMWVCI